MDKWCVLAAQAITDKWSVGEFSRFCDDAPDFDSAELSDVATVIWEEYKKAIAAQGGTQAAVVHMSKKVDDAVDHISLILDEYVSGDVLTMDAWDTVTKAVYRARQNTNEADQTPTNIARDEICPLCGGEKYVRFPGTVEARKCGWCKGTGKLSPVA